jgi:hypothetical protein
MRRAAAAALLLALLFACKLTGDPATPKDVQVVSPQGVQSGDVVLPVVLFSSLGLTSTRAVVEFTTDGGLSFEPATPVLGSDVALFATSPEGARTLFVWDSLADVGFQSFSTVELRVTVGSGASGKVATTAAFALDNSHMLNVFVPGLADRQVELRAVDFLGAGDGLAVGAQLVPASGVLLAFDSGAFSPVALTSMTRPFEINGARTTGFGRLLVGRDLSTGQGLVLVPDLAGTFNPLSVPVFSRGLELFAVDSFDTGRAFIVGATGTGFGRRGVLLLLDGGLTSVPLPVISTSFELRSVRLVGREAGFIVGTDLASRTGLVLRLASTIPVTLERVPLPFVSPDFRLNAVALSSADEGFVVGEDVANRRGVILRLERGVFSLLSLPVVSADFTLNAVDILPDGTAFVVGEDRLARQGLILRLRDGVAERLLVPEVSLDFDLRSVVFPISSLGFAVGCDRENLRGVVIQIRND